MIHRTVEGLVATGITSIRKTDVSVRLTADKLGKTLSLADDRSGLMIAVPLEALADLIEVKKDRC